MRYFFFQQGKTFYITPNVSPFWKHVKKIIEFSGGEVANVRRKTVEQIRQVNKANNNVASSSSSSSAGMKGGPGKKSKQLLQQHQEPSYIIVTCEDDLYLVQDVMRARIPVYSVEFVLQAVLRGAMNFDLAEYIVTI